MRRDQSGTGPAIQSRDERCEYSRCSEVARMFCQHGALCGRYRLRESNVCGLQWTWEVTLPEISRSGQRLSDRTMDVGAGGQVDRARVRGGVQHGQRQGLRRSAGRALGPQHEATRVGQALPAYHWSALSPVTGSNPSCIYVKLNRSWHWSNRLGSKQPNEAEF